CVSMNELYGEFNLATMEWKDGLIGNMFRAQVADTTADEKWTVLDGPVDALWIENMNTVLDDNKLLTLINGERIKMTPSMHMLFEVGDLAVASPATVSRCGMVYMDPAILGWRAYVKMWNRKQAATVPEELKEFLQSLFTLFVDKSLQYVRRFGKEYVKTVDLNLVSSLCRLIQTFIQKPEMNFKKPMGELKHMFGNIFIFCLVWSVGGNLADGSQEGFDTWLREYCDANPVPEIQLPTSNSIFNYFVDLKRGFVNWEEIVPVFKYSPEIPYFQMMVPTVDTVKYSYLLESLLENSYPTLFVGETGVGKSIIVQDLLNRVGKAKKYNNVVLNFSAQTSSAQTQQIMELKVEKKRKNISGAPAGVNKIVLF
ncbi:Dynein heavy chain 6, axonemal, partial [Kappamyces sp. JEL0680]